MKLGLGLRVRAQRPRRVRGEGGQGGQGGEKISDRVDVESHGGGAGATTGEAERRGGCGVVDDVGDVGDVVMVGGDSGAGEGEARLNAIARLRLRLTDGREGGGRAEEAGAG